jgi:glutamine synthetase
MARSGLLTVDELRAAVEAGQIDTVLLAMADMQGRLQGKRLAATHLLDDVLEHNAEGCNYLLAVDVDMNTVSGYAMSSWDRGYGDFVFRPDLATLRLVPWQEGTALVMCDLEWEDGSPVLASPRGVLKRQLERLAERGWVAYAGTELEFIVFRDSYEEAWAKAYRNLKPANDYNVDYSLLGTARIEPLLRRIRNSMAGAGLRVESAKGECNYGQHEIAFRYADALTTADGHVIYKNGAKEIAAQDGCSLTFMSKYNEREGNSCHIHFSLRSQANDEAVMAGDRRHHGYSELMEQFLAGQLACLRELTLFLAPNVNSYKRYAAPTWPWPRSSPPACTGSTRAFPWRRSSSATPTTPTSRACPGPCGRPATCSPTVRSPARPSGPTWSTTTPTWPPSSWTPSTPP